MNRCAVARADLMALQRHLASGDLDDVRLE